MIETSSDSCNIKAFAFEIVQSSIDDKILVSWDTKLPHTMFHTIRIRQRNRVDFTTCTLAMCPLAAKSLRSRSDRCGVMLKEGIHPIGFVQLGTNHVVEIGDFVVLSDKSCYSPGLLYYFKDMSRQTCEAQFWMGFDCGDNSPEHSCRHNVHLVQ